MFLQKSGGCLVSRLTSMEPSGADVLELSSLKQEVPGLYDVRSCGVFGQGLPSYDLRGAGVAREVRNTGTALAHDAGEAQAPGYPDPQARQVSFGRVGIGGFPPNPDLLAPSPLSRGCQVFYAPHPAGCGIGGESALYVGHDDCHRLQLRGKVYRLFSSRMIHGRHI
jgi:hypothetical protein